MILEEESISNKCESNAIFKLENAFYSRPGIEVLEQIDEIRHASIPDEYSALHALRSKFLGLSFLPA